MKYLGLIWELLALVFLLWVAIKYLSKSLDDKLDLLLPSDSQKQGRGKGVRVSRRLTRGDGGGDS